MPDSTRLHAVTYEYIGDWTLTRLIEDASHHSSMSCAGQATLHRAGDRLRYAESVSFELRGRLIHATRTYYYRPNNGTIVATFEDGSPFFSATLLPDNTAEAIHFCGHDMYVGTLRLIDGRTWTTQWDVSGTKALRISTRYTRATRANHTSVIAP